MHPIIADILEAGNGKVTLLVVDREQAGIIHRIAELDPEDALAWHTFLAVSGSLRAVDRVGETDDPADCICCRKIVSSSADVGSVIILSADIPEPESFDHCAGFLACNECAEMPDVKARVLVTLGRETEGTFTLGAKKQLFVDTIGECVGHA